MKFLSFGIELPSSLFLYVCVMHLFSVCLQLSNDDCCFAFCIKAILFVGGGGMWCVMLRDLCQFIAYMIV